MQTNNIFSAVRFGLYMRKHLLDNYRMYGMSVIVLAVLSLVILLISSTDNFSVTTSGILPVFFIGMYITGLIFTSLSFRELGSKQQGIDYLLFPASHLEKFVTTLLITTIGFLVIYHLAFYCSYQILDFIYYTKRNAHIHNDLAHYMRETPWEYIYFGWFAAQGFMLLGAIYFQRYSFIKVIFLLPIFLFLLYLFNSVFAIIFFGGKLHAWYTHAPFVGVQVMTGNGDENTIFDFLIIPEKLQHIFLFMFKYLLPPILWTLAFARLRDKEI
ncbi:hypothetical protein [Chitinophaga rhizophila]|uniref:ABC-2 type transport system permease protein n=1 Tax=Chitinophaga rhizophila TaxID=2866212 RepID=A0ABS7GK74_9BACT|nr:hypothetical protein [Chitinophaga rhizophila]MBW8688121.1 hypothetical protein [Chitinophaga rhizophila]